MERERVESRSTAAGLGGVVGGCRVVGLLGRWELGKSRRGARERERWARRVHEVGMLELGEKKFRFLAETLSKLRFFVLHSPSTLSTSKTIL
jgi:hypothetical protein